MGELIILAILLAGIPIAASWIAGTKVRQKKAAFSLIFLSAFAPNALIFLGAQQSDSITRAASIVVVPVFFFLSLLLGGLGFSAGRYWFRP